MAVVFIGIGSNLGNRRLNLENSLKELADGTITGIIRSEIYKTEPVGFTAATSFLNMAIMGFTDLGPEELLYSLLSLEKSLGRVRRGDGYQSRIIDLDILFYDDLILNTNDLIIPHPQIQDRSFVLEPLCDIAPEYIHPLLKRTLRDLRDSLEK